MTPLVDRRPDYDELLRLAEAAGEEAWDLWSWASWQEAPPDILDGSPRPDMFDLLPFQSRRNVAFTVEARPDVVATLIRENRQQAERIAALQEALRGLRLNTHHAEYCAPGDLDFHCICGTTEAVVKADAVLLAESRP